MSPTSPAVFTTMVRSGKSTYFVDVREARNGRRYLAIAENRLEGEERRRSLICVFGQSIDPFRRAVDEAAAVVCA